MPRPDEPIRLAQFLKLHGLVESGGHAKAEIQSGQVLVNGEVETRRGRRLHPGDVVQVLGQTVRVEEPSAGFDENAY